MNYQNYPNFQYDPQFNMNFWNEDFQREKNSLFKDCSKLGFLLLVYTTVNIFFAYAFYYVTYFVLTKSFTLSYAEVVTYLLDNHKKLVYSTAYQMGANISITICSLAVILIVGKAALKIDFGSFVRPSKNGAKTAGIWIPAGFVINMIFSLAVAYFTSFLNSQGVAVPTSDFSLSSPSAASIIMQFAYVVVLAPIIEEFIYRGIILGMLSKYGSSAAILLSALSFALMHGNIPQALAAFGTGIVYAVIAVQCGSIFPTILIHAANNFIANFTEFAEAIGLPHSDLIFSISEIAIALAGFYVLFTRFDFLRYKENSKLLDKKTVCKTIFTNPVILIYLAWLVYEIFKKLIYAN